MSEYGSYSEKIFDQCELNSLRASSDCQAEYIGFHHDFSINMSQVENPDYQSYYYLEKDPSKDTDCTVKPLENEENAQTNEKILRKIQTSSSVRNRYLAAIKGSPYETMELNINFKTRFCQFIRQLVDLKILGRKERQLFERYQSESPSFKSLVAFLNSPENLQSRGRLKELMNSSQIAQCILESDLRMENKLIMIKFLQVMRGAVANGNSGQKWK